MKRRAFLSGTAILCAFPRIVEAQRASRVYRLGILAVDRQPGADRLKGLYSARLSELGWQEGPNITIDLRYSENTEQVPELAAKLVAAKPDVVIAIGPYSAHALKNATTTIPIVFFAVADPVGRGLVPSLSRPGGNITGVSHFVGTGVGGKSTQVLKELVPRAARFAFLTNPSNPAYRVRRLADDLAAIGRELRVIYQIIEARSVDEILVAIESASRWRADGLIVTPDPVFTTERDTIIANMAKHGLPAVYPDRFYVQRGGLVSYGTDFVALLRRSGDYVDKILRGASPADLPIEQPTHFELALNVKTAKSLGLTIPPSLLLRADHVIE